MSYTIAKTCQLCRNVLIGLVLGAVNCQVAFPEEYMAKNRSELQTALQKLQPGDVLKIAAGNYEGGVWISGLNGTESQPISIQGADPNNPPIFEGGGSGIQITQSSHVHLSDLHVTGASGNGLNIDEGGPKNPASVGIQLHKIHVSKIGPKGNSDGIKLSGLKGFKVVECLIESWGDGGSGIDMVGCHDGEITSCTLQRQKEEKPGNSGANGVQMKGGTSNVTVSKCTFKHIGNRGVNVGGSTGSPYFRPLDANAEASNLKVVDNVFIGGQAAVAFVGVNGAIFKDNVIYMPERWAMRILQENRDPKMAVCRDVLIENNTTVFNSQKMVTAINIGPNTAPETFRFIGNTWYCSDDPGRTQRLIQLPTPEQKGRYGEKPDLSKIDLGE